MSPVHFKLTKHDGHTRRLTFPHLPPWHELATRLHSLYDIPVDKVGVSYIDTDNDEITASSDEELQDFYQTSHQPGNAIKFKVLDLSLPRNGSHSESFPPISTSNRNTFGPDTDNLDFPDWQRFTVAEYLDNTSEGPHAFVEIVNSDVSGFSKDQDRATNTESEDGQSTIQPTFADKGKQKASSRGATSTASVLEADFAQKYPVHVFNHAQSGSSDGVEAQGETPVHSPPKAQPDNLNVPNGEDGASHNDPPLPTIDAPLFNASATLTDDVATLLSTFTNIISSHPELSEGVRNIVKNATSGTYWQAHRTALSQAANEMQQSTGHFEQEAAQRVAEALGSIFRSFSQVAGNTGTESRDSNQTTQQPNPAFEGQRPFPWYQPPLPGGRHPWGRRSMTGFEPHRFPSWHISPWHERDRPAYRPPPPPGPPPPPPPPPGPYTGPGNTANFNNGVFSPFLPPPPPPPPLFHDAAYNYERRLPSPPPGLFNQNAVPDGPRANVSKPEDPVPPQQYPVGEHLDSRVPPSPVAAGRGHFHGHRGRHFHGGMRHGRHGPIPPRPSSAGGIAMVGDVLDISAPLPQPPSRGPLYSNPFLTHPHNPDVSSSKLSAQQQLRAQVEEAKRVYKEQKEMYRRERDERKNGKVERKKDDDDNVVSTNPLSGETSQGPSHIVSRAWGSYPQLEMYSTGPRRHNTHPGHGPGGSRDELNARALSRITRRLSDMGFSENSHPNLPAKIKTQMQSRRVITKEEEDDIVTNLLEELLALASKLPVASGSGAKDKDHNEGWGM